ncbi:histidine phosphatase superfamily [Aspergillus cavernicola]|uniref:Histidine phosphatase superfamily n=1 Tax=Aspergillus cavernicola TaxID=176166 RepID=A0ABR4IET1_9EURO
MLVSLAVALTGGLISSVGAETILGVVVFTRNGDRTSKHYPGYTLTNLGFQQNLQVGSDYRDLYITPNAPKQILGISEDEYVSSQIYAATSDKPVLFKAASAFLQGLYPPLDANATSETLNNGTAYPDPLDGHQLTLINAEDSESENSVWLKGNDECPVITEIAEYFIQDSSYTSKVNSTRPFYQQFWPVLENVSNYNQSALSYENAYDIFDLINTGLIHNESMRDAVSADDLFQLRTLADSHEFGMNFDLIRAVFATGAQTLMGAIVAQLKKIVVSKGKSKFSLLAGSYDVMLSFFGLYDLTAASGNFYGLPGYASTMAFELLTDDNVTTFPADENALKIRFLFRNGSDADAPLTPFPILGGESTTIAWRDFSLEMGSSAINTVQHWCQGCNSMQSFCTPPESGPTSHYCENGGMSNTVAGVIGSMVTLGVVCVGGAAVFLFLRRRWAKTTPPAVGFPLQAGVRNRSSLESLESLGSSGGYQLKI